MSAHLSLRDVTVRFEGLLALSSVSLEIESGEVLGLIGPNGAGKSTLINCVTGFQKPTAGTVTLDSKDLAPLGPAARSRIGIARTFQTPQLFERLSICDSIRLAQESAVASARRDPEVLLAEVGLAGRGSSLCGGLPYGTRRLVEVARALACGPRILLLDEPAAGLAAEEAQGLMRLVRLVAHDLGIGVLLVEHNMGVVRELSDRIVVMHHGQVLAGGLPDAVLSDPAVIEAYLGNRGRNRAETAPC